MSDEVETQPSVPETDSMNEEPVLNAQNESNTKSLEDSEALKKVASQPLGENSSSSDQPSQEVIAEKEDLPSDPPKSLDNEARLAQLEKEHETLRSQYMRIAADFDNFRKRQSRDNDDLKVQLTCNTLSEILPVVDNFERARQQLDPKGEEAQGLHRSYQGLYKQLVDVLKNLGVSPMRVIGQVFDPNLHEAVLREPSDEKSEDIILEELQRGYHLNGRVLRHALVKVSMGPGPASDNEIVAETNEIVSDSSVTETQDNIDSES